MTEDLFKTLTEVNNKCMATPISNDIWRLIAIYGSGIECTCPQCAETIYVMDPKANKNKLIDDEYYIFGEYHYYGSSDDKTNNYIVRTCCL